MRLGEPSRKSNQRRIEKNGFDEGFRELVLCVFGDYLVQTQSKISQLDTEINQLNRQIVSTISQRKSRDLLDSSSKPTFAQKVKGYFTERQTKKNIKQKLEKRLLSIQRRDSHWFIHQCDMNNDAGNETFWFIESSPISSRVIAYLLQALCKLPCSPDDFWQKSIAVFKEKNQTCLSPIPENSPKDEHLTPEHKANEDTLFQIPSPITIRRKPHRNDRLIADDLSDALEKTSPKPLGLCDVNSDPIIADRERVFFRLILAMIIQPICRKNQNITRWMTWKNSDVDELVLLQFFSIRDLVEIRKTIPEHHYLQRLDNLFEILREDRVDLDLLNSSVAFSTWVHLYPQGRNKDYIYAFYRRICCVQSCLENRLKGSSFLKKLIFLYGQSKKKDRIGAVDEFLIEMMDLSLSSPDQSHPLNDQWNERIIKKMFQPETLSRLLDLYDLVKLVRQFKTLDSKNFLMLPSFHWSAWLSGWNDQSIEKLIAFLKVFNKEDRLEGLSCFFATINSFTLSMSKRENRYIVSTEELDCLLESLIHIFSSKFPFDQDSLFKSFFQYERFTPQLFIERQGKHLNLRAQKRMHGRLPSVEKNQNDTENRNSFIHRINRFSSSKDGAFIRSRFESLHSGTPKQLTTFSLARNAPRVLQEIILNLSALCSAEADLLRCSDISPNTPMNRVDFEERKTNSGDCSDTEKRKSFDYQDASLNKNMLTKIVKEMRSNLTHLLHRNTINQYIGVFEFWGLSSMVDLPPDQFKCLINYILPNFAVIQKQRKKIFFSIVKQAKDHLATITQNYKESHKPFEQELGQTASFFYYLYQERLEFSEKDLQEKLNVFLDLRDLVLLIPDELSSKHQLKTDLDDLFLFQTFFPDSFRSFSFKYLDFWECDTTDEKSYIQLADPDVYGKYTMEFTKVSKCFHEMLQNTSVHKKDIHQTSSEKISKTTSRSVRKPPKANSILRWHLPSYEMFINLVLFSVTVFFIYRCSLISVKLSLLFVPACLFGLCVKFFKKRSSKNRLFKKSLMKYIGKLLNYLTVFGFLGAITFLIAKQITVGVIFSCVCIFGVIMRDAMVSYRDREQELKVLSRFNAVSDSNLQQAINPLKTPIPRELLSVFQRIVGDEDDLALDRELPAIKDWSSK